MKIKKSLLTASAGLVAVFGFALTSQSASARVVCNDHGDCWHTSERISYPPDLHVRVYNDRGAFLAGAVLSDDLRPGVVQVSTGAWYDPLDPADPDSLCVHGNPNVVTLDAGSSPIAQSSVGQLALVQVERWEGEVPPIRVFDPPPMEMREGV